MNTLGNSRVGDEYTLLLADHKVVLLSNRLAALDPLAHTPNSSLLNVSFFDTYN